MDELNQPKKDDNFPDDLKDKTIEVIKDVIDHTKYRRGQSKYEAVDQIHWMQTEGHKKLNDLLDDLEK